MSMGGPQYFFTPSKRVWMAQVSVQSTVTCVNSERVKSQHRIDQRDGTTIDEYQPNAFHLN